MGGQLQNITLQETVSLVTRLIHLAGKCKYWLEI